MAKTKPGDKKERILNALRSECVESEFFDTLNVGDFCELNLNYNTQFQYLTVIIAGSHKGTEAELQDTV